MIDATYVKVQAHGSGAVGSNQDMSITKGGLNTKIHLAVDAHGLFITSGTTADCTQATRLIEEFEGDHLLADSGYDSNEIVEQVSNAAIKIEIWQHYSHFAK
ncbi:MAG: transposase [Legionella longbeachae]|nr:transposase [Legionella longbeachae]